MNKRLEKVLARRYAAAPGAGYNDKQAQIIGCEFETMTEEGVLVTPPSIVDRARSADSTLHPFFEWNDPVAAELHRREQARNLMNHLLIVNQTPTGEQVEKAVFSVQIKAEPPQPAERFYVSVSEMRENSDYREQITEQAWRELRSWAQKYETLGLMQFQPVYSFANKTVK